MYLFFNRFFFIIKYYDYCVINHIIIYRRSIKTLGEQRFNAPDRLVFRGRFYGPRGIFYGSHGRSGDVEILLGQRLLRDSIQWGRSHVRFGQNGRDRRILFGVVRETFVVSQSHGERKSRTTTSVDRKAGGVTELKKSLATISYLKLTWIVFDLCYTNITRCKSRFIFGFLFRRRTRDEQYRRTINKS